MLNKVRSSFSTFAVEEFEDGLFYIRVELQLCWFKDESSLWIWIADKEEVKRERGICLLLACLMSQQYASVSHRQIY